MSELRNQMKKAETLKKLGEGLTTHLPGLLFHRFAPEKYDEMYPEYPVFKDGVGPDDEPIHESVMKRPDDAPPYEKFRMDIMCRLGLIPKPMLDVRLRAFFSKYGAGTPTDDEANQITRRHIKRAYDLHLIKPSLYNNV